MYSLDRQRDIEIFEDFLRVGGSCDLKYRKRLAPLNPILPAAEPEYEERDSEKLNLGTVRIDSSGNLIGII